MIASEHTSHTVTVNGDTEIFYTDIGSGEPVILLHGFPELAYSWRKVMPALAGAGFHVVAPDQRGYGPTIAWFTDPAGNVLSVIEE